MTKKEIINAIIEEQNKVVLDLEKSIEMYKSTSDIDEDDTLDPEDYSHQNEAQEMQFRHEERLKGEKDKLSYLESHKYRDATEKVETGSLVETEAQYIFIGFSMHPFGVNGKDMLCISEKAPITKAILGKEKGDSINIGDKSYTILNIA